MNAEQLLKQVLINRDLILRNNSNAHEHMEMLQTAYPHLINGEIAITLEMNKALAKLYFDSDYASAIDISLKAIDEFKNAPYKKQLAFHMKMVAHCQLHQGEHDIAMLYLNEAIETLPQDDVSYTANKADMLYALAQVEEVKDAKSPKMAEHLLLALNLLSDDVDTVRKANCLLGLGNYYNNIDKPEQALAYFHEAIVTFEKEYLLQHMSNTYSNMGICYLQLQDYAQAELYMQKALDLRIKAGGADMLAISYSNFGRLYKMKEEYAKASDFLTLSQKISTEIGFKQLIIKNDDLLNEIEAINNKLKQPGQ